MRNELHTDPFIAKMVDAVYEDETSRKNWDSSFIESIRNYYYDRGGLTEKQLAVVESRYERLNTSQGERRNYGN